MWTPCGFYTTAADTYLKRLQSMLSFLRPRAGRQLSQLKRGQDELIQRQEWNLRGQSSSVKTQPPRSNAETERHDILINTSAPPENGKHGSANWLKVPVGLKIKKSINFVMYKNMTLAPPQAYLAVLFWKKILKRNQGNLITSPHSKNHHWLRWLPMWVKILHF